MDGISPYTPAALRERSLADLGFSELTARLATRCRSPLGSRALSEIGPAESREAANRRLQAVSEALSLLLEGGSLPARHFDDVSDTIELCRRGSAVGARELFELAQLLELTLELAQLARREQHARPVLAECIGSDARLAELFLELKRCVEPSGELSDNASSGLARARKQARATRQELLARIDRLIVRYAEVLSGQYYAERDGRYVLPVRADAHIRVAGIVLGSSSSGATLYVEPHEMSELGNKLSLCEAAVEREELLVLAELGGLVGGFASELCVALSAATSADRLRAIAEWALEVRGVVLPISEHGELELAGFRHPLLLGREHEVVENDIRVERGKVLVVSGPNAGGKTVALKCLGLAALMAKAGLPIPARDTSRIGWIDDVISDIGDDQSLLYSLSTFSAHIAKLVAILSEAGAGSLILLDELCAGTDPEEGASLAQALLEALAARGSAVAVTTHYERLKELAAVDSRFENASVGFDFERMAPTFRLTQGMPGASSALHVAARFQLASEVIERARALLPEQSQGREDLVRELTRDHDQVRALRRQAEQSATQQAELLSKLERDLDAQKEREQKRLRDEVNSLYAELRSARSALRAADQRLRQSSVTSPEVLKELDAQISAAGRSVALGSPISQAAAPSQDTQGQPADASELTPGRRVFVSRIGAHAEVLEAPVRGQVRVRAGALKLTVPVAECQLAKQRAEPRARHAASAPRRARSPLPAQALRSSDNTLDLRGERVDRALDRVEAFVDRMISCGESAGFVLHGHGTGALKSAVREHLATVRAVASVRPALPDEGGDAFTLFWLA